VVRLAVDLTADAKTEHQVLLSISDNGPGIPAELQATVFERFVRADDSRSRNHGSTGLGLAIAHAVVKAHGGSLTLISDTKGTEFRISLPAGNGSRAGSEQDS
jgi:two-component system OmpR family sensor kinase